MGTSTPDNPLIYNYKKLKNILFVSICNNLPVETHCRASHKPLTPNPFPIAIGTETP